MNESILHRSLLVLSLTVTISMGCQSGKGNPPPWLAQQSHSRSAIQTSVAATTTPNSKPAKTTSLLSSVTSRPQAVWAGSPKVASNSAKTQSLAGSKASKQSKQLKQVNFDQDDATRKSDIRAIPYYEPANDTAIAGASNSTAPGLIHKSTSIENAAVGLPIDFPTVLRLAGADNWNVKIAQQRICEAVANYNAASVAWLPSLNFGVGYNHHEGEIQATDGTVQTVSRGSLFAGGGSRIGNNPIAGGSGGPQRLSVSLSLSDAIFQPLATRQLVNAERYRESRVFNDVMLDTSTAYFELVRAQSRSAIAQENQRESESVAKLTIDFVEAGKGTAADQQRMHGIVNERRRDVAVANSQIGIASAQLATLLQMDRTKLDPNQGLFALETDVVPIDLVQPATDLGTLVDQALAHRQEIKEANWRAHSSQTQYEAEKWRPYLPNVGVGTSNGVFGGGTGGNLPKMDTRSDIDLQMVWEVRNMGAGNKALRDSRRSQLTQSVYISHQLKDQIANEVAAAYHDVQAQSESMLILQDSIRQAESALRLNVEAIQGLEGLPLESVQSLNALAAARTDYLDSVINYNLAQLRLLRAIGQPIAQQ